MNVFVTEYRCTNGHYVVATAWEGESSDVKNAETHLRELIARCVAQGALNPWCGMCKSRNFHCHTEKTAYRTLDEATPALKAKEAEAFRIMEEAIKAGKHH